MKNFLTVIFIMVFSVSAFSYSLWQGTQAITWSASDPDNHPISFSVYYGVTKHEPKETTLKATNKGCMIMEAKKGNRMK